MLLKCNVRLFVYESVPDDLFGVTRLRVTLLAPACTDEEDKEDEEEEDEEDG